MNKPTFEHLMRNFFGGAKDLEHFIFLYSKDAENWFGSIDAYTADFTPKQAAGSFKSFCDSVSLVTLDADEFARMFFERYPSGSVTKEAQGRIVVDTGQRQEVLKSTEYRHGAIEFGIATILGSNYLFVLGEVI